MSTASSTSPRLRDRAPSSLSAGRWKLGQRLAQCRWTATYEASSSVGGEPFVVKTIRPDVGPGDRLIAHGLLWREAEIGLRFSHRHVLPTLDVVEGDEPWLIQPLFPKARSAAAITDWPLATKLWVMRQIAEGLAALHHAGWLHGNVRPNCIVASPNGHATLLDLGWSRQLGSEECDLSLTNFAGSLVYAAPEMFDDVGRLAPAADVYSLGAVLWELLTERSLWPEYRGPELVAVKRMRTPPEVEVAGVPFAVASLARQMLSRDPLRRPTLSIVVASLVAAEIEALSQPSTRRANPYTS